MNNDQKAAIYGRLLNEHTRLQNEISSIKGESIELNQQQSNKIKELEEEIEVKRQLINKLTGLY